ncbi:phosphatase PAP2 family protein [Rubrivivax sp. A210]|uniref:phosphatase PAP2 family protein n=1 Tax=Rubrivivax sp. A210 TaxID=2772301 RepID=UPI001F28ABFC|nr:phosphatase PAP2 family protein [Rubrivivax sp. A210]
MPPHPATERVQSSAASLHWLRDCDQRLRHRFWLKFVGISAFMSIFFVAYFHLLRHPARPVTVMPLTALDQAIPVQPGWMAAYVSLWVYVGLAPGLLIGLRALIAYGAWIAALCATGLLCFYLVPTAVPRLPLAVDLAQHPAFAMLQGVDAAGNACPSLHVATALHAAIWLDHLLRRMAAPGGLRLLNAAWLLLIVYSTLATKQHVVWDVVGGTLLALPFAWASLRWFPHAGNGGLAGGGR